MARLTAALPVASDRGGHCPIQAPLTEELAEIPISSVFMLDQPIYFSDLLVERDQLGEHLWIVSRRRKIAINPVRNFLPIRYQARRTGDFFH
jgi:hypothetical protein